MCAVSPDLCTHKVQLWIRKINKWNFLLGEELPYRMSWNGNERFCWEVVVLYTGMQFMLPFFNYQIPQIVRCTTGLLTALQRHQSKLNKNSTTLHISPSIVEYILTSEMWKNGIVKCKKCFIFSSFLLLPSWPQTQVHLGFREK